MQNQTNLNSPRYSSFFQDSKHETKSSSFRAIKPESIQTVLRDHGFSLVHLKSGNAKHADKAAFQTTVARYRSETPFEVNGLSLDLIFKVPHLYGALQGVLGLFRGACANQLNVGTHFKNVKIKHIGDPLNELNNLIPMLVSQQNKLVQDVQNMRAINLGQDSIRELTYNLAKARLGDIENVQYIDLRPLTQTRRFEDVNTDLFTVFNIVQENIMRHGVKYTTSKIENDVRLVQNFTTRRVNESGASAIELNSKLWDIAASFSSISA